MSREEALSMARGTCGWRVWGTQVMLLLMLALVPLYIDSSCALGMVFPRRLVFELCAALLLLMVVFDIRWRLDRRRAGWLVAAVLVGQAALRAPVQSIGAATMAAFVACWACCEAFLLVLAHSEAIRKRAIGVLLATGAVIAALAILQHFDLSPLARPSYVAQAPGLVGQRREVFSLLGHNLHVSMFLAALVPLAFMQSAFAESVRWGDLVALALITMGLFVTYSRGAMAFAAVGTVLGTCSLLRGRWQNLGRKLGLTVLVMFGTALCFSLAHRYPVSLWQRFASTKTAAEIGRARRSTEWAVAWCLFRDAPVFGLGPGAYQARFVETLQRLFDGDDHRRRFHTTRWAHNDYLEVLAEFGIAGALVMVLLIVVEGWGAFRVLRGPPSPMAAGAVGSLFVVVLCGLLYFPLSRPEMLLLLVLFATLLQVESDSAGQGGVFDGMNDHEHRGAPGAEVTIAAILPILLACGLLCWAIRGYGAARDWGHGRTGEHVQALARAAATSFRYQYMAARQYGYAAFSAGRFVCARENLLLAGRAGPLAADVAYLTGIIERTEGPAAAIVALEPWLDAFPRSGELRSNLGAYHMRCGNDEQAERALRMAIAVAPGHFPAHQMLLLVLGRRHRSGEVEAAAVAAALANAQRRFPERGSFLARCAEGSLTVGR